MKKEKILEPRNVIYRKVSKLMPHCPICKEELRGNNSGLLPFECSCGIWESDWMNPTMFKIKILAL